MDQVQLEGGRSFLIALPEKALADKIQDDRGTGIRSQDDMRRYLMQNLRIPLSRSPYAPCSLRHARAR
jgi:hypothetical protein